MKSVNTYIRMLLLLLLAVAHTSLFAQDPHYTQSQRVPTFYNPAAAGQGVENIRLTMLYRSQWASIGSPFKTEGLFFDKQVSHVGLGATIVNNSAGPSGIRQLQVGGTLSYRLLVGKHQFASGVQVGIIQKSFDPSKMTFDDQYTPDQGFDPNNPTSETFSYTKITRPDFGAGFLWSYGVKGKGAYFPYAGVSLMHINQPKESFIELNNSMPRKMIAQAGVGVRINENVQITPMVVYMAQQFSKEMMMGFLVNLPLENRDRFETGIYYRSHDAVAISAGYQWNSFLLGASYDVNVSGLTGGQGAFELTLTYIPKAGTKAPVPEKEKAKKEKPAVAKTKVEIKPAVADTIAKPEKLSPEEINGPITAVAVKPITQPEQIPDPVKKAIPLKTAVPAKVTVMKAFTDSENTNVAATHNDVKETKATNSIAVEKTATPEKATIPPPVNLKERPTVTIHNVPVKAMNPSKIIVPLKQASPVKTKVVARVISKEKNNNTVPAFDMTIVPSRKLNTAAIKVVIKKEKPVKVKVPARKTLLAKEVEENTTKANTITLIPARKMNTTAVKIALKKEKPVKTKVPARIITVQKTAEAAVTPEVKNTPVKITDSDNDGVPDAIDECPFIKGSVATHGCPDTDGDGVVDRDDQCPMEIGSKENHGCPSAGNTIPAGTNIEIGNIEFLSNSAEVKGIYKLDIIEPALDSLWDNADYTLVIAGHTDNEGDAYYNMKLSQARADVVKAIFMKKGLDENRIITVAYGETMPLRTNSTDEGKLHNRRVEIHVIRVKKQ